MITLQTLYNLHAEAGLLGMFEREFPNGAANWEQIAYHPKCKWEWIRWIAVNIPELPLDTRMELAMKTEEPDMTAVEIAHRAPGLTATEREEFRIRSFHPKCTAGHIAAYADNLTFGERVGFLLLSDAPQYWAARAAKFAPDLTYRERCEMSQISEAFKKVSERDEQQDA